MYSSLGASACPFHDLRGVDNERAADGKEELVGGARHERGQRRCLGCRLNAEYEYRTPEHDSHEKPRSEVRGQPAPRLLRDPVERQAEAAVLDALEGGDH